MGNRRTQLSLLLLPLTAYAAYTTPVCGCTPIREPVERAAEWLMENQEHKPCCAGGYWPEEESYTGSIVAGLVDANDKRVWREGLIECLAQVDDATAEYPVRALGAAVWALARTGALDDSAVDSSRTARCCWRGKTLADLPDLLLGHWISAGDMAGSFYERFDHGNGFIGPAGGGVALPAEGTHGAVAYGDRIGANNLLRNFVILRLLERVDRREWIDAQVTRGCMGCRRVGAARCAGGPLQLRTDSAHWG